MTNPPPPSPPTKTIKKLPEAVWKTTPCCTKKGMKKGSWTREEDELLSSYIKREGEGRWQTLPKKAGLRRCGKSCRLRWMNYLRPSVKRGHISGDEEDLIIRLHRLLGNRWSLIAGRIPGRTDNEIKNYWNTHLSKKLISQGIDPRTHKPLLPSLTPNQNFIYLSSSTGQPDVILQKPDHDTSNPNRNFKNISDLDPPSFHVLTHNDNEDEDKEDDIHSYSRDDVFSSFLDSLINEETRDDQIPTVQSKHDGL